MSNVWQHVAILLWYNALLRLYSYEKVLPKVSGKAIIQSSFCMWTHIFRDVRHNYDAAIGRGLVRRFRQ